MSLSKTSKSRSGELQWIEADVDVHDHHYWHCPDCSYFNNIIISDISDKCPQITHSNRSCVLKIIWILGLIISVVIIVPLILLHLWPNPNKGLSNADTSYAANEGRLFEVSAFFKEKVGISVSDHYNANATLYILKQSPPLTRKYGFSVKTTVIYDEDSSYSSNYWHYYLHRKSNVTIWACVDSVCDPYHIYIVKGPQNYASWLKTHHSEKSVSVNTEICSYGLPSLLTFTVEEDDHYYFFYYSTGQCHRNDIIHAYKKAGNLSFYVEKFEYSVSNVQVDGMCNTYELDSCIVNLPLKAGSEKVLITVNGYLGQSYNITFTSTMRKWPIPFIVISCIVFLVSTTVIIVCLIRYFRKKRKRRQYASIQ